MTAKKLSPTTTYPAVVGSVIVKLRNQIELRQVKLAAAIGVTQATWSRIENGSSALTIEQLGVAAGELGITASEILIYADKATIALEAQGIQVVKNRINNGLDIGMVLISSATLSSIITTVILEVTGVEN